MTNTRTIEETESGWRQAVRAQVLYWDADGSFVSRSDYVRERDQTRNRPGYGSRLYGQAAYGGS